MSAVIDTLLAPDVRPFAVAAAIMVVLAAIELLTTMVGFSISHAVGKEIDLDAGHHAVAGLVDADEDEAQLFAAQVGTECSNSLQHAQ